MKITSNGMTKQLMAMNKEIKNITLSWGER